MSFFVFAKTAAMLCKSCHVAFLGSSLSSDIATQVTCIVIAQCSSKFSSLRMLSLVSSLSGGLVFFFSSSPHHIGGLSRVAEAMSEVEQEPLNQSKVDEEKKSNSLPVQNEAGALTGETKLLLEEV